MIETKENRRAISIRHKYAGVFLGYLNGPGTFEGTIEIEGRRVWSWSGGRLEMSQVSKQGLRKEDSLGEWETLEINVSEGLIELRTIKRDILEQAKNFPAAKV